VEAKSFSDPWFRQFDQCTDGLVDSKGFTSRLPLRLESSEAMIHGFVDAKKMWADFDGEAFQPILVGGKAVVSIWFNNFTHTDCGGEYWESWYNTFVTPTGEPQIELDAEAGPMGAITHEKALIYLQRVVCGDTPNNPGAAMKAIVGGRSVFGFPKHPVPGEIKFAYEQEDGKNVKWVFDAKHSGKKAVSMSMRLPEADEGAMTLPLDAKTGPDTVIGAPQLGGTHQGHNGAHQVRFGQAFKCTQHVKPWDAKTDKLTFGDDDHYAKNIKKWDFTPILKVHSPDFKIAAFKPSNWISGNDAAKAVAEHEAKMALGVKAGAL
jgi:hypothetical protein